MKNQVLSMLMIGLFSFSALSNIDAESQKNLETQEVSEASKGYWDSLSAATKSYIQWGSASLIAVAGIVGAKVMIKRGTKIAAVVIPTPNPAESTESAESPAPVEDKKDQ